MSSNTRVMDCTVGDVWEILSDGWLYPLFVVGASRMRVVDGGWPSEGTRLHHSVGGWPALLDDTTEALECEPQRLLRLSARAWPAGRAEVTFRTRAQRNRVEVVIEEDAVSGPGRMVPSVARQPLLHWRNEETLRRLALLAERRAAG
ncbi:SRPBCC family protein [Nocardioides coralli]|uniref:SRPBCC family protein n=1 Tax=Nocardioides coralli TaxID=2872154 RepID=UPI001CA40DD8|nr:SRPBCC family protein [Nocardioides coralli]QZY29882.1 SRPBCC family protein [Nocardioides coralli]